MRTIHGIVANACLAIALFTATLSVVAAPANFAYANTDCNGTCEKEDDGGCKNAGNQCDSNNLNCVCVQITVTGGKGCKCAK